MSILKTTLFILLNSAAAYGQKLPSKQQGSILAPATIKIDGKATEWDNKFQAYNNATDVFYTLANNDEVLYLIIQARERDVVDKILRGGITLTVNHTINKNDGGAISITYPILRDDAASNVLNTFARKSNEHRGADKKSINVDALNQTFDAKSKLIQIAGIKTITDDAISIYNENGIKASAKFDDQLSYTYELAIPLKYLMLPDNGANKFSYHIKVNEPAAMSRPNNSSVPPPPMLTTSIATTDFWGEYKLAKK